MEKNELNLYLVVLGGRISKANSELHDVRWVIGSKIQDTFDDLRKAQFGTIDGLHIDSYKKITSIEGYKIQVTKSQNTEFKINPIKKEKDTKKLWFINLGGYDPKSMQEKHKFGLVVASTALHAKNIAKTRWLNGSEKKHKDDINCLQRLSNIDDCQLIRNINNWEIVLIPEDKIFEEKYYPDWLGYLRIDNKL